MNRDWHAAHPMPEKATLDQRVAWHLEHAEACGCRDLPASLRAELARRGQAIPARKGGGRAAPR
ncbi:hypothetical protein [Falsiroseomonas tokyonensis]|uniref:Uncharacterized protein n=1 Tax=Falsiroseomonas tokyonensis TaxID=430521 RepID=A0ABV7BVQ6_9PROT|nr:hypothetical protein [Falsiroseomonas tokyonensis]MBU8538550.1 hypothetical protein [Falsiroseomonas tokyonensis]